MISENMIRGLYPIGLACVLAILIAFVKQTPEQKAEAELNEQRENAKEALERKMEWEEDNPLMDVVVYHPNGCCPPFKIDGKFRVNVSIFGTVFYLDKAYLCTWIDEKKPKGILKINTTIGDYGIKWTLDKQNTMIMVKTWFTGDSCGCGMPDTRLIQIVRKKKEREEQNQSQELPSNSGNPTWGGSLN